MPRLRWHDRGPVLLSTSRRLIVRGAVAVGLSVLCAGALHGQSLELKRTIPAENAGPCPSFPVPAQPAAEQRTEAGQLLAAGDQAALLGDQRAAQDYYRRVAELDPTDAAAAYRLARTYEELGASDAAAGEYCRFLFLAPDAADAGEVRARVAELLPARGAGPLQAAEDFRAGLAHFDAGQLREAERAFTRALRQSPGWTDIYINRALVREAQAEPARALQDLETYLRLQPSAPDASVVQSRIAALQTLIPRPTASGAFARGIVVPGLGQIYTGRPVLGALILGGVGAALIVAVQPEQAVRIDTAFNPFGQPYPVERTVTERPDLALGVGLAVGIHMLGALEAYLHAGRTERAASSANQVAIRTEHIEITPVLSAAREGLRFSINLRLPRH